jgi:hypothetical protein
MEQDVAAVCCTRELNMGFIRLKTGCLRWYADQDGWICMRTISSNTVDTADAFWASAFLDACCLYPDHLGACCASD